MCTRHVTWCPCTAQSSSDTHVDIGKEDVAEEEAEGEGGGGAAGGGRLVRCLRITGRTPEALQRVRWEP